MKRNTITIIIVVMIVALLAVVLIGVSKRQQAIEDSKSTPFDSITSAFGRLVDLIGDAVGTNKHTSGSSNSSYGLTDEQIDYWEDYYDDYDWEQWELA